jgi:hypothetical protein
MICSFRKCGIAAGFIALWILVLASNPLLAAGDLKTVEVEALRVTVDSEWAMRVTPGYWPIRFDITNLGDDRTIEILGQGTRWWSSGDSSSAEIHQTLNLKRADRKRFTISVPVFASNENLSFQIRERGKTLQVFSYSSLESGRVADESSVLVVGDSASPYGETALSWLRPLPPVGRFGPGGAIATPSGGVTVPRLDLMLDPSRLPTDWLGFTSLRAVFIGPEQWRALENAQRDALLTWVACGGDLMVVDGDPSNLIPEAREIPGTVNLGAPLRYFLGRIYPVKSSDVSGSGISEVLSRTHKTGFDSAFALPANRDLGWLTFAERGFRLNIPGVGGLPVRSYFAILVVFSVLIGPVNYVVLWRKKRQVLLVLTTPLISILFILLIAGYAVLGEGLSIRERTESFTVLDQSRKQAATRASVSMYAAGMAPRNGLRFPRDMAIFPVGIDGRGSRDRETLDLTELQQFTSGIIRARAPSNFEEISFRPARERLTFNRSGETVTVLNGLGATMSKLFYRYGGKTFTLDKPLRDGEQGTLHLGGDWDAAVPAPYHVAEQFRSSGGGGTEDMYVAFLENSPFIDMGTKVEERGSRHVILGYAGGRP